MNSLERIIAFVEKVHRRLVSEYLFRIAQTAICTGLIFAACVYLLSRLFVFPYFGLWSLGAGVASLLIYLSCGLIKKPDYASSLYQFDSYFPENLLITALQSRNEESSLLHALREKTAGSAIRSYDLFKLRKKKLWRSKSLIGIGVALAFLLTLITFPSATQLQAKDMEVEKELVKEIKKEVAKSIKKTTPAALKKELEQLEKDLKATETTEEALRELIKKQKELKLREQKLTEKQQLATQSGDSKSGLTDEEQKELAALKEATKALAEQAGETQTALSKNRLIS